MSQIFRHLTLLFLLLKIRASSSTSMLRMTGLIPQESSKHATGSNITSFATLTGSLMTGYYTLIYYNDAKCSVVQYADCLPLNVCFPWFDGNSFYFASNGTHVLGKLYRDYSCAILTDSAIFYQPIRSCDQDYQSASVTDSYPTIVSSAALLTAS